METLSETLKTLSALVAMMAFGIGLAQYVRAQQWKRAEFVAHQIRDFENNSLVRRAMKMLDFRAGSIMVEAREIKFDDLILTRALPHEDLIPLTTPDQADIRLAFCDFFDGLERLNHFVEAGLITPAHLNPYLPYWFNRFTTSAYKSREFMDSIWTFIDGYEYEGVRELASKFGFRPPDPLQSEARTKQWLKNPTATSTPTGKRTGGPKKSP